MRNKSFVGSLFEQVSNNDRFEENLFFSASVGVACYFVDKASKQPISDAAKAGAYSLLTVSVARGVYNWYNQAPEENKGHSR